MNDSDVVDRATALRQQFDESFAAAPETASQECEDLLLLAVSGTQYAVRLSDVAGLMASPKVTRFRSELPALLGVAGVRGDIRPVYDLAALVGSAPTASHRWMAITTRCSVGLAFTEFLGHLRVTRDAVVGTDAPSHQSYARDVVTTPGGAKPILDVAAILDGIEDRARRAQQVAERR